MPENRAFMKILIIGAMREGYMQYVKRMAKRYNAVYGDFLRRHQILE